MVTRTGNAVPKPRSGDMIVAQGNALGMRSINRNPLSRERGQGVWANLTAPLPLPNPLSVFPRGISHSTTRHVEPVGECGIVTEVRCPINKSPVFVEQICRIPRGQIPSCGPKHHRVTHPCIVVRPRSRDFLAFPSVKICQRFHSTWWACFRKRNPVGEPQAYTPNDHYSQTDQNPRPHAPFLHPSKIRQTQNTDETIQSARPFCASASPRLCVKSP
jgi:hypothetical protein